jgi:uncharacterized protein YigE (DUF2233 family)
MRPTTLFLTVSLALSAPLMAAPQVQFYQVAVNVRSGGASHRYGTSALVVAFPPGSQAQIAYIGGKRGIAGTYHGMPALVAANPRALVMNGGYYTNDPSSPAGLLLVNGRIISPFGFSQSATLCVDHSGRLKIHRTAAIRANAKSIAKMCFGGLQSYPIVVNNGLNDIRSLEMGRPSYRRTLIGLRRDGSVVAVFFRSPVHLYVAAEFARARQVGTRKVQISGEAGRSINASGGLGLVDVVNLSGDTDSFAALNGKVLAGDINRQLPSAIVIK